jgi:hypothetical protein
LEFDCSDAYLAQPASIPGGVMCRRRRLFLRLARLSPTVRLIVFLHGAVTGRSNRMMSAATMPDDMTRVMLPA